MFEGPFLPGWCIGLFSHFRWQIGMLHFEHLRSNDSSLILVKHDTQTGVEFGAGATMTALSMTIFSPRLKKSPRKVMSSNRLAISGEVWSSPEAKSYHATHTRA